MASGRVRSRFRCWAATPSPTGLLHLGSAYSALVAWTRAREAGGRFLVRGLPAKTYEAGIAQRTVVIEFDSVAAAIAAHDSPGYQAALVALGDAAERDMRIVEGI